MDKLVKTVEHARSERTTVGRQQPGAMQAINLVPAQVINTSDVRAQGLRLSDKPLQNNASAIFIRQEAAAFDKPAGQQNSALAVTHPFAATDSIMPSMPDKPVQTLQANLPMQHPGWARAIGEQVVMIAKDTQEGNVHAQLRLDPPDMGPLRITLTISDGVAHASFMSAHPAVRSAMEQGMQQLAQAFAQSGLSLGNTHVGQDSSASQFGFAQGEHPSEHQQAHARADSAQPAAQLESGLPAGQHQTNSARAPGTVNTYA